MQIQYILCFFLDMKICQCVCERLCKCVWICIYETYLFSLSQWPFPPAGEYTKIPRTAGRAESEHVCRVLATRGASPASHRGRPLLHLGRQDQRPPVHKTRVRVRKRSGRGRRRRGNGRHGGIVCGDARLRVPDAGLPPHPERLRSSAAAYDPSPSSPSQQTSPWPPSLESLSSRSPNAAASPRLSLRPCPFVRTPVGTLWYLRQATAGAAAQRPLRG